VSCSPGLRGTSYPGIPSPDSPTPKRVVALHHSKVLPPRSSRLHWSGTRNQCSAASRRAQRDCNPRRKEGADQSSALDSRLLHLTRYQSSVIVNTQERQATAVLDDMNLRQKTPNVPAPQGTPEPPHGAVPSESVSISVDLWLAQNASKTSPKSVRFHECKFSNYYAAITYNSNSSKRTDFPGSLPNHSFPRGEGQMGLRFLPTLSTRHPQPSTITKLTETDQN
jgi:hypothetical protein